MLRTPSDASHFGGAHRDLPIPERGEFYNEDATASALDTDEAINAFKEFTEYYTDYKLDKEFDPINRFRTGEMPLIISDYTTYNILQVSAPEIRGLWGLRPFRGLCGRTGL